MPDTDPARTNVWGSARAAGASLLLFAAGAVLFSCGQKDAPAGGRPAGLVSARQGAAGLSARDARIRRERGHKLYLSECSGCHGERGRGDGPAAAAIDPKPRDFVKDRFKFRSTASGEPPRREDIIETIARGMPGSAMPAYAFLSEEERVLIADHVRRLAGIDELPEPDAVVLPPEPPLTPGAMARGREVYKEMQCAKCHGDNGRGDGESSATLKDDKDRPIQARDMTLGLFRRGRSAAEIYRTFTTGIAGTPMPAYSRNSLTADQGWDLARYILSLPAPPVPPPSDPLALGRRVVEQKQCFACHVIEGRGATVGPSLDVSSRKLRFEWVREFLKSPRAFGKIYPFTPYRMPDLGLTPQEIEGVIALLAQVSGRPQHGPAEPQPVIDSDLAAKGQLYYVVKCAECHNLGSVIPTPEAKRQGPDLIHISQRLRFDWIPEWVKNPLAVYPGTSMVDTNLTDEEIQSIRAFLWKQSAASQ